MYNREDILVVSYEEMNSEDFKHPYSYYVEDAMQNYVFVKTRSRSKAKEVIDDMYGVNRYSLRTTKMVGSFDEVSAR